MGEARDRGSYEERKAAAIARRARAIVDSRQQARLTSRPVSGGRLGLVSPPMKTETFPPGDSSIPGPTIVIRDSDDRPTGCSGYSRITSGRHTISAAIAAVLALGLAGTAATEREDPPAPRERKL